MLKVRFETLGCKLNQIETESLAHAFRELGFSIATPSLALPIDVEGSTTPLDGEIEHATDGTGTAGSGPRMPKSTAAFKRVERGAVLCVVNTCTVTGKAEQKARHLIRSLLRAYPDATVLVTGCYAEVESAVITAIDPRVAAFPGSRKGALADLPRYLEQSGPDPSPDRLRALIGEFCLTRAAQSLDSAAQSRDSTPALGADAHKAGTPIAQEAHAPAADSAIPETFRLSTDDFLFHSRASLKIEDGCDNHCSYCRIRLARGKAVSLDADEVIARVRRIEDAGWGEVILTGVNLSQYRSRSLDFADLLDRILAETGRIAIRIGSLYPERVDEAILPALANERVRPHFHLSVQSGSDRILRAMRRPYEASAVLAAVERLRAAKGDPFIACDVIAGFPGETDEDFAETVALCERARFAAIHAFPFSARPGTEAWSMGPKVPERVAGERVAILTGLSERGLRSYAESWIGRTVSAISEESAPGGPVTAITANYLSVALSPGSRQIGRGTPITVRITGIGTAEIAD